MGVVLRNLQNVVPLRRARLRKDVEILRHIFGVQKFDLGIICVDNRKIQRLNHIYRKRNQPTDVLSFPFYEVQPKTGFMLGLYAFFIDCRKYMAKYILLYIDRWLKHVHFRWQLTRPCQWKLVSATE